jgi:hypothetical protein
MPFEDHHQEIDKTQFRLKMREQKEDVKEIKTYAPLWDEKVNQTQKFCNEKAEVLEDDTVLENHLQTVGYLLARMAAEWEKENPKQAIMAGLVRGLYNALENIEGKVDEQVTEEAAPEPEEPALQEEVMPGIPPERVEGFAEIRTRDEFHDMAESMQSDVERQAVLDQIMGGLNVGLDAEIELTEKQAMRLEQLELMEVYLGALHQELGMTVHGPSTMARSANNAIKEMLGGDIEENGALVGSMLDEIESARTEIILNPELSIKDVMWSTVEFIKSRTNDSEHGQLNFKDFESADTVVLLKIRVLKHLRDLNHYEEIRHYAEDMLKDYISLGRGQMSPTETREVEREADAEIDEKVAEHIDEWRKEETDIKTGEYRPPMSEHQIDLYIARLKTEHRERKITEKIFQEHFSPNSLPEHEREVWDLYKDVFAPLKFTEDPLNIADASWDTIIDELIINAPLIMISGGVGPMIAKGVSRVALASAVRMGLMTGARAKGLIVAAKAAYDGSRIIQLGALTAEGVAFAGTHSYMAKQLGMREEWLLEMDLPDAMMEVFWSVAALGAFKGAGKATKALGARVDSHIAQKFLSGTLFTSAEHAHVVTKMVTNNIRNTAIRQLIQKTVEVNAEAGVMLLLGAVQRGFYEGSLEGFFEDFEEEIFHAYVTAFSLKAAHGAVSRVGSGSSKAGSGRSLDLITRAETARAREQATYARAETARAREQAEMQRRVELEQSAHTREQRDKPNPEYAAEAAVEGRRPFVEGDAILTSEGTVKVEKIDPVSGEMTVQNLSTGMRARMTQESLRGMLVKARKNAERSLDVAAPEAGSESAHTRAREKPPAEIVRANSKLWEMSAEAAWAKASEILGRELTLAEKATVKEVHEMFGPGEAKSVQEYMTELLPEAGQVSRDRMLAQHQRQKAENPNQYSTLEVLLKLRAAQKQGMEWVDARKLINHGILGMGSMLRGLGEAVHTMFTGGYSKKAIEGQGPVQQLDSLTAISGNLRKQVQSETINSASVNHQLELLRFLSREHFGEKYDYDLGGLQTHMQRIDRGRIGVKDKAELARDHLQQLAAREKSGARYELARQLMVRAATIGQLAGSNGVSAARLNELCRSLEADIHALGDNALSTIVQDVAIDAYVMERSEADMRLTIEAISGELIIEANTRKSTFFGELGEVRASLKGSERLNPTVDLSKSTVEGLQSMYMSNTRQLSQLKDALSGSKDLPADLVGTSLELMRAYESAHSEAAKRVVLEKAVELMGNRKKSAAAELMARGAEASGFSLEQLESLVRIFPDHFEVMAEFYKEIPAQMRQLEQMGLGECAAELGNFDVNFSRVDGFSFRSHEQRLAYFEHLQRLSPLELAWYRERPPKIDFTGPGASENAHLLKQFTKDFISERVLPELMQQNLSVEQLALTIHFWQTRGSAAQLSVLGSFNEGYDIAGRYRAESVSVGHYKCPNSNLVPEMMRSFSVQVESFSRQLEAARPTMSPQVYEQAVVQVGVFIQQRFVDIHPMRDGNGRTSRMLYEHFVTKHLGPNSKYRKMPMAPREGGEPTMHPLLSAYNEAMSRRDFASAPSSEGVVLMHKLRTQTLGDVLNDPLFQQFGQQVQVLVDQSAASQYN